MKMPKQESGSLSLSPLPIIATILNFSLNLPTMVNCYCKDRWYTFTLLKRYVVLFWKMKQDHRRWRYHRRLLDYQSPYFKSFLIIKYLGIIKFFWIIKDSISIGKYFLIRLSSKRIPRISATWDPRPTRPTKPSRLIKPARPTRPTRPTRSTEHTRPTRPTRSSLRYPKGTCQKLLSGLIFR